jgi:predicted acylesterase/phospholipase RssA
MIRPALALLCSLLLSACGSDRPLAFECSVFDRFRVPVGETPGIGTANAGNALIETIAATFPQAADTGGGQSQFLVLSGGGQWGAFGAGLIKGWPEKTSGPTPRPARFDMVTGVSTGALQATFAFLGRGYDQQLLDAYTISNERELLKRHGALFFLRHGSMADTGPLESYVRQRVRPLIDQVAAAENAGRKLLVGVVDGLDGRSYAVDLTRIATELSGRERENCYVGALLASSAVPVVFRQLTISGRPYLDGGVRNSVFVTDIQDAAGQALSAANREGTVYVLMNGDVTPSTVRQLPPKLFPTVNRLRSIVFNQIELSSIYATARRFPKMRTMVATASGHQCHAPQDEGDKVFSPTVMSCLRRFGEERWKQSNPWAQYTAP